MLDYFLFFSSLPIHSVIDLLLENLPFVRERKYAFCEEKDICGRDKALSLSLSLLS
jgi:hypothetical protein